VRLFLPNNFLKQSHFLLFEKGTFSSIFTKLLFFFQESFDSRQKIFFRGVKNRDYNGSLLSKKWYHFCFFFEHEMMKPKVFWKSFLLVFSQKSKFFEKFKGSSHKNEL